MTTPTNNNTTATNTNANTKPVISGLDGARLLREPGAALRAARREGPVTYSEGAVLSWQQAPANPEVGVRGGFGWSLRNGEGALVWESFHTPERDYDCALEEAVGSLWGAFSAQSVTHPAWVALHRTGAVRLRFCEEGGGKTLLKRALLMGARLAPGRGWRLQFGGGVDLVGAPTSDTVYIVPAGAPVPEEGWASGGGVGVRVGGGYPSEVVTLDFGDGFWDLLYSHEVEEIHAGPTSGVVGLGGLAFATVGDGAVAVSAQ
ncbi:hypothetical protein GF420_15845 [candidate division GN15 bacterium]|nr:hypothetical protein [candidate division GN15 bacterium]